MDKETKEKIIQELTTSLAPDNTIEKIIIFGSFIESENPNDIDVALFSSSSADYLSMAMHYRKLLRTLSNRISIDVVPVSNKSDKESSFYKEIINGTIIYEKRG